jgi:periplasmic divalent cation tolerance protein
MSDGEFVFVYCTFPDLATATRAADELVRRRLAACVNLHGPVTSIYEWQGKVENGPEFVAFIKTRRMLANDVIAHTRPMHPYSLPCFLILPIEGGSDDYLAWVREQTEQIP